MEPGKVYEPDSSSSAPELATDQPPVPQPAPLDSTIEKPPVPTTAQISTAPVTPAVLTGSERLMAALQLVSGIAAVIVATILSPTIIFYGIGLIFVLPLVFLAINNFRLYRAIHARSNKRLRLAVSVLIFGLLATALGYYGCTLVGGLGRIDCGNNCIDSVNRSASAYSIGAIIALVVGVPGSIWPFVYFRKQH